MAESRPLDGVIQAARQAPGRGLPPVHLWNPPNCGEIDIVIKPDGRWLHEGGVIGREALVRLFSTVLRKDPDGIYLVTNVGDTVEAGPENPIRVEMDAAGEPRPYVHVRRGLEALIARPVFYELVEMAEERDGVLGVSSDGVWFPLGAAP